LENDLPRAEAICSQFLDRWPHDTRAPEILLRQGQIFRQMGLNNMALTKFYAVMTAALSLKDDQLDYYQRLVLESQMEIAETHYLSGQFPEAADLYLRILKEGEPSVDRQQVQFRIIRSLRAVGRNDEAVSQAQDFLARYSESADEPEVRFQLAETLKQMGQNSEALRQVLLLLQEEKAKTADHPDAWAYWQQRAGNEIANQLYREGDYVKALDIYISLAQLDPSPAWQLPVDYQIGITYERLMQPQKAIETYKNILSRESETGTNASPGLQAVFDMARWRANFLQWQGAAEVQNRSVTDPLMNTNAMQ
jgi:tetratricopeptide (TPR) repeat protein